MKCDITFPPLRIRLSPSVWREWIEIPLKQGGSTLCKSPSVWREWIEIRNPKAYNVRWRVSLRVEGVD